MSADAARVEAWGEAVAYRVVFGDDYSEVLECLDDLDHDSHDGVDSITPLYALTKDREHIVAAITAVRTAARAVGYCIAVHGSEVRDLDLVAIPWTDDAVSADELEAAVREAVDGFAVPSKPPMAKPHGRIAYQIHCVPGPKERYIDLSVLPRTAASDTPPTGAGT